MDREVFVNWGRSDLEDLSLLNGENTGEGAFVDRTSEGESTGKLLGSIVGVFQAIGLCLGIGAIFALWGSACSTVNRIALRRPS